MSPTLWIAAGLAAVAGISAISAAVTIAVIAARCDGRVNVSGFIWVSFVALAAAAYVATHGPTP